MLAAIALARDGLTAISRVVSGTIDDKSAIGGKNGTGNIFLGALANLDVCIGDTTICCSSPYRKIVVVDNHGLSSNLWRHDCSLDYCLLKLA